MMAVECLIDSGATINIIHPKIIQRLGIIPKEVSTPFHVYNVDGSSNKKGKITQSALFGLKIFNNEGNTHEEIIEAYLGDMGEDVAILGAPW